MTKLAEGTIDLDAKEFSDEEFVRIGREVLEKEREIMEAKMMEPWNKDEVAAVFGTPVNGWIPTDRKQIQTTIFHCDLSSFDTETLVKIYKLLGLNKEPRDIVDRIHAGLPVE